jgi:hypothetical protein
VPDLAGALPALVALAVTALVALAIVVTVRVVRRSPRARAAADRAVADAAGALLALDDAVRDLDVAFEASDAVESPDVPADLRRARATAHRTRDRGFGDLLTLEAGTGVAARRRDQAQRVRHALDAQTERVALTRTHLSEWTDRNRTPERLLVAARRRRDDLVSTSGDTDPLIAVLRARFDHDDWADAAAASRGAMDELVRVDAALDRAAAEPGGDALLDATAALHRAARHLRDIEDDHRIALQAADNVEAEVAAARVELREAIEVAASRPGACRPGAAERLRVAADDLDAAAASASRRPREAIAIVARVREERDHLLDEAVSMRQRLEAARAALPGTLACARAALADAETRHEVRDESSRLDAESRIGDLLRQERARRHLAEARAATEATRALASARRAWAALR